MIPEVKAHAKEPLGIQFGDLVGQSVSIDVNKRRVGLIDSSVYACRDPAADTHRSKVSAHRTAERSAKASRARATQTWNALRVHLTIAARKELHVDSRRLIAFAPRSGRGKGTIPEIEGDDIVSRAIAYDVVRQAGAGKS